MSTRLIQPARTMNRKAASGYKTAGLFVMVLVAVEILLILLFGMVTGLAISAALCTLGFAAAVMRKPSNDFDAWERLQEKYRACETKFKAITRDQEVMNREARVDQLTRLGNRHAFFEFCERLESDHDGIHSVVAILDFNRLKRVNDTHGHDAGDALLCEAARRLDAAFAPKGRIFRLGGDEFVIVYQDGDEHLFEDVQTITEQTLEPSVTYENADIEIDWSMGIAGVLPGSPDFTVALAKAEAALQKAKMVQRSHAHIFTKSDEIERRADIHLLAEVQHVLTRQSLEMHGQPIVKIEGEHQKLYGIEALLRAKDCAGDAIRPDLFVRKAVQAKRAGELTFLTTRHSAELLTHAPEDVLLTLNLSPEQFIDENLCEIMGEAFGPSNIDPRRLVVELSEKILHADLKNTQRTLETLRKFGVKIALDDFGSENTGVATVIDFDFDIIKTDPKLLMSALTNKRSAVMFQKIVEICDALNIICIAEGVETIREFDFAKRAGCEYFQGYYFGRPALVPVIDGDTATGNTQDNNVISITR